MAEIPFPSVAKIRSIPLHVILPGQLIQRSIFTGTRQVLNRGFGIWSGTVEIELKHSATEAAREAGEIESFLNALKGGENFTRIPVHRPTISAASGAIDAIINNPDGTISFTLAVAPTAAQGFRAGAVVSVGKRMFMLRSLGIGGTITLDPQMPLPIGTVLEPVTTVRAHRPEGSRNPGRHTPSLRGPWSFAWEEDI